MSGEPKYYLIDAKVMPSIFHKVLKAKRLLESGNCRTASEAADMALLSRSAFYKYKDAIRPFFDKAGKFLVCQGCGVARNVVFGKTERYRVLLYRCALFLGAGCK